MKRSAVALLAASLLAWSVSSEAEEAKRKVAFLAFSPLPAYEASFNSTLRRLGWEEGRNLVMERRYTQSGAPLSEVAATLVRLAPDVIVAPSAGMATAVRRETTTIPIVVLAAGDLVGSGLAESLARPGGNVTGTQIVQRDLMGKRIQLLKEALPRLARVAALQDTATVPPPLRASSRKAFEPPARALQIEPLWYEVGGVSDLEDRFRTMAAQQTHAVIVLMAYGVDFVDLFARGAVFVDKILRGAQPRLLPVEQPTRFEFAVNLKTAKGLGLTLPQSLLLQTDLVID